MLKQFPFFSKLSIHHKDEIVALTASFEPYSDFNFTSLFCWNIDDTTEISILHGNLVIKMPDYITGEPVYSILGSNEIDKSITELLKLAGTVKLVPKIVVQHLKQPQRFKISEDRDQFDYVYRLSSQADLMGGYFKIKRNKISKFMRTYEDMLSLKKIDFKKESVKQEIEQTFWRWVKERNRDNSVVWREAKALNRLFDYSSYFTLVGVQVFLNDKSVGFSINEVAPKDYAICHFQKAVLDFEHIDVFLSNLVAKELKHFGCQYVNWEQDLGILGLRELKQSYGQEFFLEKYTINLC